jgi:nucleoside-diphosphate-sugar epimerase
MSGRILITGADGYLGQRTAWHLLTETSDRLVLTVRAADRAELESKAAALRRELGATDGPAGRRVEVTRADLRDDDPFATVDAAGITCIVHMAARTAFNQAQAQAREVNVLGTVRVGQFANRCPDLDRLLLASTLFSAGRRTGDVAEAALGGDDGFVNHYEWSKCEAENLLLETCPQLPVSVVRLPTIVADDETGRVGQYNVFHNTLKLYFYGLLSLVPGDRSTRQYFATAELTGQAIMHLIQPQAAAGFFHMAPGPDEALELGEIIDAAFDVFESDPGFHRRRLLRPQFCDIESFRDLAAATRQLSASPMAQAFGSVAPFAEQLFLDKAFDNRRMTNAWPGFCAPKQRQLVAATCENLVRTRWGRSADENTLQAPVTEIR